MKRRKWKSDHASRCEGDSTGFTGCFMAASEPAKNESRLGSCRFCQTERPVEAAGIL